jgi:hypothetical protein
LPNATTPSPDATSAIARCNTISVRHIFHYGCCIGGHLAFPCRKYNHLYRMQPPPLLDTIPPSMSHRCRRSHLPPWLLHKWLMTLGLQVQSVASAKYFLSRVT